MRPADAKRKARQFSAAFAEARQLLASGEPITAAQMAKRIARHGDQGAVLRQIQHWTVMGLFKVGLVAPPETHVGRGRARRYPAGAIYWAAILAEMARRGMLVGSMLHATTALSGQLARDIAAGRRPWLARALDGERVLLLVGEDPNDRDGRQTTVQLLTGRDKLNENMLSGTFVNVTAALQNALRSE